MSSRFSFKKNEKKFFWENKCRPFKGFMIFVCKTQQIKNYFICFISENFLSHQKFFFQKSYKKILKDKHKKYYYKKSFLANKKVCEWKINLTGVKKKYAFWPNSASKASKNGFLIKRLTIFKFKFKFLISGFN